MKEPSEMKHRNPDNVPTERNSKTKEKNNEFEFCKVCKLNHNQGRRHNYLPNHVKSLSSFLSRFQSKLSDVRLFLKNPSSIRPELAFRNRFWCVFCDIDVTEHGSSFAWLKTGFGDAGNYSKCKSSTHPYVFMVVKQILGKMRMKNLKSFMWKHGGGMNRVDAFRISEADLAKKCISMKKKGANEQFRVPLTGPSNDIHNELKFDYVDNFDRSHNSNFPNGVLPLQNHTNENYQVSHSDLPGGYHDKSFLLASDPKPSNNSTGNASTSFLNEGYLNNRQREADMEGSSTGFQKLTRISSIVKEVGPGNVHSGAPPPWFDVTNGSQLDCVVKRVKSKLNPKRVGAEWAERRKMEMEMKRNGELPAKQFDASWLPNFGGVWQFGSRKDTRKEFKVMETDKSFKDDEINSSSLQLQPYVSKRKRQEANE
ncbi:hypothetical protein LXL04_005673 [Taraxacum kok-saghyz]